MLLAEEQQYIEEMEAKEETTLERQAKMRERAKFLKEKREQERLKLVQEKLDQRWRYVAALDCYVPVKSKLQHPPPPPGHLNFWKNFVQIPPSRGHSRWSNAPTPGKLFGSFYYAPEAVYVNMV